MTNLVSKSKFKAQALAYFRQVERTGQPVIVTDRGQPVLQVVPYRAAVREGPLTLRDTVVRYTAPTKPVADGAWEAGG
ncbi:MAG TPA: type II toxin-antitoxin system prevent-host-death family antitoxin [Gemmatimonadales bacterium]|jgi:prevent-host-death family protein